MQERIKDLDRLKELCLEEPCEAYISLNGNARSSKVFQHFPDGFEADDDEEYVEDGTTMRIEWEILHEIDDSSEGFENDEAMLTGTHVGEALKKKALYAYDVPIRPKCDQCQVMVINGYGTHEEGCPKSYIDLSTGEGHKLACPWCDRTFTMKNNRQDKCNRPGCDSYRG